MLIFLPLGKYYFSKYSPGFKNVAFGLVFMMNPAIDTFLLAAFHL